MDSVYREVCEPLDPGTPFAATTPQHGRLHVTSHTKIRTSLVMGHRQLIHPYLASDQVQLHLVCVGCKMEVVRRFASKLR